MAAGGIMNVLDAYSHPLFNSEIDERTQFRTRSLLCCSIADTSNNNVAVLQVSWHLVLLQPVSRRLTTAIRL